MKRVLVVEDEASIREMVALNLKMAGWEVVEAPSAERALELMHHGEECDAALLDIMLPGMDGLSLCETIRREGTVVYCEMRVVDLDEPESIEYKRIATIGSQQLQARMVTSYYGLSMDYIESNTVLLGTA